MAKRRDWNSLSKAYQSRLLRSGITRKAYEGGASLKAARGHATTPEKPEDAVNNPSRYTRYRAEAKTLRQSVWERKKQLFDNTLYWNEGRARKWVMAPENGRQPGIRIMKQFMAMTDQEIYDKVAEAGRDFRNGIGQDDDWYFLFYR